MLELRNVYAGYGAANVLRAIDLHVADGETVALVGANGAGKSTLLKTISGLVSLRSGEMHFAGAPLAAIVPARRIAAGIAHVPEGREVFGGLTVGDNLRLGAYAQRRTIDARELDRRFDDVLVRFPALRPRLGDHAADLSGGQQQMLAIGRGLMARPTLLLLDEPSLGLSPALVSDIFRVIADMRDLGMSILIAEQNARMTLAIADRGYVLENGSVVASDTGANLLNAPAIVERYLGMGESDLNVRTDPRSEALTQRLKSIFADRS